MNVAKDNFVSVVIVAAGKGSRMGIDISKQYIEISGTPVLALTIQAFEESSKIDEIIVVVNEQDIPFCKQRIIDCYEFEKVKVLVAGGAERQKSVFNGLGAVNKNCDIVLIHDGARPFVDKRIIENCINAALEYNAACAGVPVKDTIKISNDEGYIKETLERSSLWSIQTPQSFKYSIIFKAHEKAQEEGFLGTDDAVLVERIGVKVKLVMGSYNNIKITTKEDLVIGEAILMS